MVLRRGIETSFRVSTHSWHFRHLKSRSSRRTRDGRDRVSTPVRRGRPLRVLLPRPRSRVVVVVANVARRPHARVVVVVRLLRRRDDAHPVSRPRRRSQPHRDGAADQPRAGQGEPPPRRPRGHERGGRPEHVLAVLRGLRRVRARSHGRAGRTRRRTHAGRTAPHGQRRARRERQLEPNRGGARVPRDAVRRGRERVAAVRDRGRQAGRPGGGTRVERSIREDDARRGADGGTRGGAAGGAARARDGRRAMTIDRRCVRYSTIIRYVLYIYHKVSSGGGGGGDPRNGRRVSVGRATSLSADPGGSSLCANDVSGVARRAATLGAPPLTALATWSAIRACACSRWPRMERCERSWNILWASDI
eukprot:30879-Pelagococcus_subviridis.AAC.7